MLGKLSLFSSAAAILLFSPHIARGDGGHHHHYHHHHQSSSGGDDGDTSTSTSASTSTDTSVSDVTQGSDGSGGGSNPAKHLANISHQVYYGGVYRVAAGITQLASAGNSPNDADRAAALRMMAQGNAEMSLARQVMSQANAVASQQKSLGSVDSPTAKILEPITFDPKHAGPAGNRVLQTMEAKTGISAERLAAAVNQADSRAVVKLAASAKGVTLTNADQAAATKKVVPPKSAELEKALAELAKYETNTKTIRVAEAPAAKAPEAPSTAVVGAAEDPQPGPNWGGELTPPAPGATGLEPLSRKDLLGMDESTLQASSEGQWGDPDQDLFRRVGLRYRQYAHGLARPKSKGR